MATSKAPYTHGTPLCTDVIGCLHECFEDLESGDPSRIARWNADPYFERDEAITQEIADKVIAALDTRLNREIDNFPAYHHRLSGANAYTELHRLPPAARLGLVQRLSRIKDQHG